MRETMRTERYTDQHAPRPVATVPASTLRHAVEQSSGAIVITDLDGNIEYANPAFSRLTGYALEEVVGQHTRMFASGTHPRAFYKDLWDTILSGREWNGEVLNRKKDGTLYWEALSISPVIENRQLVHFVATKEDSTERRLLVDALEAAKREQEKISAMKDAFLATISHEIRTPLNVILGFSSLLEQLYGQGMAADDRSYFEGMRQAGDRLLRTMDLLVNISAIISGNYAPCIEEYDVVTGLESLVDQFSQAAHEKRLALEYQPLRHAIHVRLDRYAFEQSMQHLIDNAIKFTRDGRVSVSVHDGPGAVCIEVVDTGEGMSEDFLSHAFVPFSQEDSGITRRHEGLGVGLSLTKRYIEANKGTLSVESEKGRGTRFRVHFPVIS